MMSRYYNILYLLIINLMLHSIQSAASNESINHYTNKSAINVEFADIYLETDDLGLKYKPTDLASGYPDLLPPVYMRKAIIEVANIEKWEIHQYARAKGEPQLVEAVAHLYSILMKRKIDAFEEVLITGGAMQSISFGLQAFLNIGDEVLVFEPFYLGFNALIKITGAVLVTIPFRPIKGNKAFTSTDLTFDPIELESKISHKTKMILLNNPNNPTGKAFTMKELQIIANLCIKHDLIALVDEVFQFNYFDGTSHIILATLPNMWERTITVNSGGKIFALTGWRIGWSIGPANLLWQMATLLVNNICAISTPMQLAFAKGLEIENQRFNKPTSYYLMVKKEGQRMRNRFLSIFDKIGIKYIKPKAGQFIVVDWKNLMHKMDLSIIDDNRIGFKLIFWLLKQKKLLILPLSLFYSEEHKHLVENMTRISITKSEETIKNFENILLDIANN